jgi:transposase
MRGPLSFATWNERHHRLPNLALDVIEMRKGLDGLYASPRLAAARSFFGSPVRIPRPQGQPDQDRPTGTGTGVCLFTKRLEHGVFLWPSSGEPSGTMMLTSVQLSMLIDGIGWRAPERQWQIDSTAHPQPDGRPDGGAERWAPVLLA